MERDRRRSSRRGRSSTINGSGAGNRGSISGRRRSSGADLIIGGASRYRQTAGMLDPVESVRLVSDGQLYVFSCQAKKMIVETGDAKENAVLKEIQCKTAVVPPPRVGFSVTDVGGHKFILFGGHGTNLMISDLWFFDALAMTWIQGIALTKELLPRHSHAAIFWNGVLYVFGGICGADAIDQIAVISLDAPKHGVKEWSTRYAVAGTSNASGPVARAGHSLTKVGNAVYMIGGQDIDGRTLNDHWELTLNPIRPAWSIVSYGVFPARSMHASCICDGVLTIAGGFGSDGMEMEDAWCYQGGVWKEKSVFNEVGDVFACGETWCFVDQNKTVKACEIITDDAEEDKNEVEGSDAVSPLIPIEDSEQMVRQLRHDLTGLATEVLDAHVATFSNRVPEPADDEMSILIEKLEMKLEKMRCRCMSRRVEQEAEIKVLKASLKEMEGSAQRPSDELYARILEYVEKEHTLERHYVAIDAVKEKNRRIQTKSVRSEARLASVMAAVTEAEQYLKTKREEIWKIKKATSKAEYALREYEAMRALRIGNKDDFEQVMNQAQKANSELRTSLGERLATILPKDVKGALTKLVQLGVMLHSSKDKSTALGLVQEQVRATSMKLQSP